MPLNLIFVSLSTFFEIKKWWWNHWSQSFRKILTIIEIMTAWRPKFARLFASLHLFNYFFLVTALKNLSVLILIYLWSTFGFFIVCLRIEYEIVHFYFFSNNSFACSLRYLPADSQSSRRVITFFEQTNTHRHCLGFWSKLILIFSRTYWHTLTFPHTHGANQSIL